jgi:hypothetical protein
MSASASSEPASDERGHHGLARDLTLFDAINLVIGTIIGSGIFLVPAEIARAVHTSGWMLAVWVIGGVRRFRRAVARGASAPRCPRLAGSLRPSAGFAVGASAAAMLFTVATARCGPHLSSSIYLGAFCR